MVTFKMFLGSGFPLQEQISCREPHKCGWFIFQVTGKANSQWICSLFYDINIFMMCCSSAVTSVVSLIESISLPKNEHCHPLLTFVVSRSHLIMRLTQLKARWQETQQRVQQHGNCLEGLMGHWQLYEVGSRRLSKLLRHIKELLPPAGLAPCSLQQLQCSVKDFEVRCVSKENTMINSFRC